MAKSFKKVASVQNVYDGMWSQQDEPEKIKQTPIDHETHEKSTPVKKAPEAAVNPEQNKQAPDVPDNTLFMFDDVKEAFEKTQKKQGRGRPKMDEADKKRHFNLLLKPATINALNRAAGRIQAETGQKITITALVTQLIDDFLAKAGG